MKKELLLIIFCSVLSVLTFAQSAPDFAVTDSDGKELKLYDDFLNEGKVVMLKIFFVSCPPCNDIAPQIQALYEDWGSGQNDVEFIELSTLNTDSDFKINGYKAKHSITFPSVGGDGGSVAAVQPYKDGDFGVYSGTPLFVVISPNGSVNFDVFGFGSNGTMIALEEAFLAAGAMKPITSTIEKENILTQDLKVSPNPFTSQFNIDVTTSKKGQLTYQLFNILGTEIERKNLGNVAFGQHNYSFPSSHLKNGTYIVKVNLDDQTLKSVMAIKK